MGIADNLGGLLIGGVTAFAIIVTPIKLARDSYSELCKTKFLRKLISQKHKRIDFHTKKSSKK